MSSATMDEASALFSSGPTGPSTHPEDALSNSRSPSPPTESSSNPTRPTNGNHWPSNNGSTIPTINPDAYSVNDANTGPKGVIADARAYERALFARRKFPSSSSHVGGGGSTGGGGGGGGMWPFSRDEKKDGSRRSKSRHSTPEERDQQSGFDEKGDGGGGEGRHGEEKEEEEKEEEEEFLHRWRNERLSELRTSSHPRSRRQSPSVRRYGVVQAVDAIGYLDAIEKVARETIVVVCIYDDQSERSLQVEEYLVSLASKHMTTRFIKLHYLDAEMDEACVPAILAYKEGELFANLVAVVDEIPRDRTLSVGSLEGVLRSHRIVS